MKLTVHRGTHEIGGTCIELESQGFHLLLDFGMPLVNADGSKFALDREATRKELILQGVLPNLPELYTGKIEDSWAILISHAHLDHHGLSSFAHPKIPLYMSKGTKALMEVNSVFQRDHSVPVNIEILKAWQTVSVGPFSVKPYLVDHSAPDAMAFQIEAEGKYLFYTGDFRTTGRKHIVFDKLVEKPPENIDFLICEGTMLDRWNEHPVHEKDLEDQLAGMLKETDQPVFLFASGQNIDRLVTAYCACKRSGRTLVIDLYTAYILDKLKPISPNNRLPQPNWDIIRIKYWKGHRDILVEAGMKDFLFKTKANYISMDSLKEIAPNALILSRDNGTFLQIMKHLPSEPKPRLLWSMWKGYLERSRNVKPYAERNGLPIEYLHTSGHATPDQLRQLIKALNPGKVIPVHTFSPKEFDQLTSNLLFLEDRETVEL